MKLIPPSANVSEEFNKLSEQELWNLIQSSDHSAFAYLYRRYAKELFQYGYYLYRDKTSVEDVIHDVFVSIWLNREKQTIIRSIKAYLYSSVRRGILKKKVKQNSLVADDSEHLRSQGTFTESSFEENIIADERDRELVRDIRKSINALGKRQREVIFLRFYQNLSYAEISTMLGIDQNYAYNLASKAFASIKSKLVQMYILLICLELIM